MKVTGEGRKKVLIVAEAPGQQEDNHNTQLTGPAGRELQRVLSNVGISMRRDCWLTNAVICRPSKDGENRKPTTEEVNHCRPNLANTLHDLQPDVVIPLGEVAVRSIVALAWKDGEVSEVGKWVGWKIPSRKLNTWICPSYHPSYLHRALSDNKPEAPVIEHFLTRHLYDAFALRDKPWKEITDYAKQVTILFDPHKAASTVRLFLQSSQPVAIDLETTTLKPDGSHAEIICCAVSDGRVTVSFPWQGEVVYAIKELLLSRIPKIAANLRFESRWFAKFLGIRVNNWLWDTVVSAHWLRCQPGICSLKFQAFVLLGMEDYSSHLDPYIAGKDSNSPNRLKEVDPETLLLYCGQDALLECLVAAEQMKGLRHGEG